MRLINGIALLMISNTLLIKWKKKKTQLNIYIPWASAFDEETEVIFES